MAISIKSGSLYFLREKDCLTSEVSKYVKIGLVKDQRMTSARIAEHQTGNPREIIDFKTFESPFVEYLETQLHYRNCDKRVRGEWFLLEDVELKRVLKDARKLIRDFAKHESFILECRDLAKKKSTANERTANSEERAIWRQLVDAKLNKDVLQVEKTIVGAQLRRALGDAGGIDGVISVSRRGEGEVFDQASLAKDHSRIFKKYVNVVRTSVSGSFLLRGNKQLKKELPDLYARAATLKSEVNLPESTNFLRKKRRTDRIETLHQQYLDIQRELCVGDWEIQKLEAKLKCLIGISQGLIELCAWNRMQTEKTVFNLKEFRDERPELYKKYLWKKPDSTSVIINSWRPYSWG